MKFLATALGLASAANAHTLFTNLFVDGKNQGDGTCVRQPSDPSTANGPIYPVTGDVMACGRDGNTAVKYTCPAPGGAQLTFQFREHPSSSQPGAIAEGHRGPCSVYVKKVDDIQSDPADGAGWFKIWEDGYDEKEDTWCVDRLRANGGLLSVDLPTGLPSGYYLVRPEVLALHNALDNDPQFYAGCAQVFIEDGPEGPLEIPDKYEVSIPGYVDMDTPGLTFNIYNKPLGAYPIPGPDVWIPSSQSTGVKQTQKEGVVPSDCQSKNGNWCAKSIAKYSGQSNCWASSKECWNQAKTCWDSTQPSGYAGCTTWNDFCNEIDNQCESGNYDGPPEFDTKEVFAESPGPIPKPYGQFESTDVTSDLKSGNTNNKPASSQEPALPSSTASSTAVSEKAQETKVTETVKDTDSEYDEPKQTEAAQGTEDIESKYTKPEYTQLPSQKEEENTPTTTSTASSEQTSASSPGNGLKISEDGRCGGETGQTCEGSTFGGCCSRKGKCGRKSRHCDCGCQKPFGICNTN